MFLRPYLPPLLLWAPGFGLAAKFSYSPTVTDGELREFFERASGYTINLDGRISRNSGGAILKGNNATVYQGTLAPGTEVAIKTPRGGLPGDERIIMRVLREVHLWSKLCHENIVPLLGISTEFDLTISILSEWMPLDNTHDYVQNIVNDPRPLVSQVYVVRFTLLGFPVKLEDIASGLYYLHSHELGPIVHGDLTGFNVLVSSDRRGLLSGFGSSTLAISAFSMSIDTRCGGTVRWMAPELLDECPASTASDMWAFGMTILELFTRAEPFSDCRRVPDFFRKLLGRELPPRPIEEATQFRLTDAWWEICISCWEDDPSSCPPIVHVLEKVKTTVVCILVITKTV